MSLFNKLISKMPEKHHNRASKTYRTIKGIINAICWLIIIALAIAMITFLVSRVNGGTPSLFGYTFHRISSGSMEPALQVEDVIIDKEIRDINEVNVGDIITFQGGVEFENHLVTHRVVVAPYEENGTLMLQTKGDANEVADSPIRADTVKSIYITKINFLAKLYSFFLSPWGLLTFIGVLLVIFFDELINIVRILAGHYDEDNSEDISEIIKRIQKEDAESGKYIDKHEKNKEK